MIRVTINAEQHEFPSPLSLAEVLEALRTDPRRVAVEVNGEVAPREDHANRSIAEGDRIEIVGPVGGG